MVKGYADIVRHAGDSIKKTTLGTGNYFIDYRIDWTIIEWRHLNTGAGMCNLWHFGLGADKKADNIYPVRLSRNAKGTSSTGK